MAISRASILAAIQEAAKANGGSPPGVRVFRKQTGIKQSDWSGKYWARWNDALAEAGFAPNKAPDRIDDEQLFAQIIPLVRRLQKRLTVAELRLARRENPEIGVATIERRFGTVEAFYQRLRAYAAVQADMKDVAEILEDMSSDKLSTDSRSSEHGFVYLIKSGAHYKIGKSKDIERRIKEIKVALPEAAILLHSIHTDDPDGIEAYWHRRFANQRANGEWFALSAGDVAAFRRRKFQ